MAHDDHDLRALFTGGVHGLLHGGVEVRTILALAEAVDVVALRILEVGGSGLGEGFRGGSADERDLPAAQLLDDVCRVDALDAVVAHQLRHQAARLEPAVRAAVLQGGQTLIGDGGGGHLGHLVERQDGNVGHAAGEADDVAAAGSGEEVAHCACPHGVEAAGIGAHVAVELDAGICHGLSWAGNLYGHDCSRGPLR